MQPTSTRELFESLLQGNTLQLRFVTKSALNSFKGSIYVYRMRYNKSLEKMGLGADIFAGKSLSVTTSPEGITTISLGEKKSATPSNYEIISISSESQDA